MSGKSTCWAHATSKLAWMNLRRRLRTRECEISSRLADPCSLIYEYELISSSFLGGLKYALNLLQVIDLIIPDYKHLLEIKKGPHSEIWHVSGFKLVAIVSIKITNRSRGNLKLTTTIRVLVVWLTSGIVKMRSPVDWERFWSKDDYFCCYYYYFRYYYYYYYYIIICLIIKRLLLLEVIKNLKIFIVIHLFLF